MAKYKLKALNVLIGGRLFKKEEDLVFDSEKFNKGEFDSAVKAGFFEPVVDSEIKTEVEPVVDSEIKRKHKN
jgi:hypothetical protein